MRFWGGSNRKRPQERTRYRCDTRSVQLSAHHTIITSISFASSPPPCMSARRNKSSSEQPRLRNKSKKEKERTESDEDQDRDMPSSRPMAVTSGLNAIHIAPRTPKTPRTPWNRLGEDDTQEVELSLLGEEERREAARGLGETEEQGYANGLEVKRSLSAKDRRGMALLIVLCECWSYCCKFTV